MELIDRENVLKEIDDLKQSPWFNSGKNVKADYQHCMFLNRKEGVEVTTDLCVRQVPTVKAIPLDTVKAMREEIKRLSNANPSYWNKCDVINRADTLEIIDKLIAECEGE